MNVIDAREPGTEVSPINPTSSVRSFRPSLLRFAETTVKADYNRSRLQPLPHTQDCLDYCTSFARATLIPSRSSLCNAARHTTACYLQSKASQHSGHRPPADFATTPARQRCPHAGPLAAVQQRVDGLPIHPKVLHDDPVFVHQHFVRDVLDAVLRRRPARQRPTGRDAALGDEAAGIFHPLEVDEEQVQLACILRVAGGGVKLDASRPARRSERLIEIDQCRPAGLDEIQERGRRAGRCVGECDLCAHAARW